MDSFMDKLAQRLNAQEMIKANAQADAQELNRLREQAQLYDAYLKELRVLNLKNAESIDKIHDLALDVDALTKKSIEKLEAVEVKGGSDAETVEKIKAMLYEEREELTKIFTIRQAELVKILQERQEGFLKAFDEKQEKVIAELTEKQEKIVVGLTEKQEKIVTELTEKEDKAVAELAEKQEAAIAELAEKEENFEKSVTEKLENNNSANSEITDAVTDFVHKECVKVYRNVQAVVTDELKAQTSELEAKFDEKLDQKVPKKSGGAGVVIGIITLLISLVNLGGLGALGYLLLKSLGML